MLLTRLFIYLLIGLSTKFLKEVFAAYVQSPKFNPVVKASPGAYFRQHEHLIPYETTAQMFFRVEFPKVNVGDPGECSTTDILCQTQRASFNLARDLRNFVEDTKNGRSKRQILFIAAGAAGALILESIFSRFSKNLFGSEGEAVDHLYQFQKSIERKNYGMYANLTHVVMESLTKSEKHMWFFEYTLESTQRELLYLVQMQALSSNIQLGIERCANNLIPTQFISTKLFKKTLVELSQKVNQKGFKLSIGSSTINEYLKLNLADCFITPQSAYVMINIPITKEQWKIIESVPVSFRSKSQTCQVSRSENDILAISQNGKIEIIDSSISGFCDIVSDHLCLVPKFSKANDFCAINMYSNATITEMEKSCKIDCVNSTALLLLNVESNVVVITNAKSIEIKCPSGTRGVSIPDAGAVEIVVECNCTYLINGHARDLGDTCIESVGNNATSVIIPYFHFDMPVKAPNTTMPENMTSSFIQLDTILQANAPAMSDAFLENWHTRDVWIVCVTIVVIGLVGFALFCCWCFCK